MDDRLFAGNAALLSAQAGKSRPPTVPIDGLAGASTSLIHINQLINNQVYLTDYHIMAIPGGFSYGDDIAAGILLANELKFKLIDKITEFFDRGGLILGICNGFQVLVRSGLLPRINSQQNNQQATLAMNTSTKFECRWVNLQTDKNIFSESLPGASQE